MQSKTDSILHSIDNATSIRDVLKAIQDLREHITVSKTEGKPSEPMDLIQKANSKLCCYLSRLTRDNFENEYRQIVEVIPEITESRYIAIRGGVDRNPDHERTNLIPGRLQDDPSWELLEVKDPEGGTPGRLRNDTPWVVLADNTKVERTALLEEKNQGMVDGSPTPGT